MNLLHKLQLVEIKREEKVKETKTNNNNLYKKQFKKKKRRWKRNL